jgi:hypothetical protein
MDVEMGRRRQMYLAQNTGQNMAVNLISDLPQMAKGWFEKKVVGFIVNRWEKGLH